MKPGEIDDDVQRLVEQRRPEISRGGVLSPLHSALRWLSEAVERYRALAAASVPDILLDGQGDEIRAAVAGVEAAREGAGPAFGPLTVWDPPEVIPPPRVRGLVPHGAVAEPLAAAFVPDGIVLHYRHALVRLDLGTLELDLQPLGECDLAGTSGDGTRLLFKCGANLRFAVYDARTRDWADSLEGFPAVHVASAVSSSISLVDIHRGLEARVAGHRLDDAVDFVLSPDARWLWARIAPARDDLGIIDVERGASVFDPWASGGPGAPEPDHGHDPTPRALVRRPDGRFRLVHGASVRQGTERVAGLDVDITVAAFDLGGDRLAVVSGDELRVLDLDDDGAPRAVQRIGLGAVGEQLGWSHLPSRDRLACDEATFMCCIGTVPELAGRSVAQVREALGRAWPPVKADDDTLARLIAEARSLTLRRCERLGAHASGGDRSS